MVYVGPSMFGSRRQPVSYTHLDVYKRQVYDHLVCRGSVSSVPPDHKFTQLNPVLITNTLSMSCVLKLNFVPGDYKMLSHCGNLCLLHSVYVLTTYTLILYR